MSNALTITEVRAGEACVLSIAGRIDNTSAPQLMTSVQSLLDAGEKNLVLDFTEVLYLTSAAFRVLLVVTDEAERRAARFVLCSVMGQVRELFELGGLLEAFSIYASRDEALQ